MFANYLKIALRHIRNNKGFSLLNILGLSLGLSCAILILLWIQDEVSYDKFHSNYATLHQVMENHHYNGKVYTYAATPGPMAAALKVDMPEVRRSTRVDWGNRWLFGTNDKPLYEDGNLVDPDFFSMFSFKLLSGNAANLLPNERSLVITEKLAKKIFGDKNPVGKLIKVNNKEEFEITGVIATPPLNSSIQFGWLASFKIFEERNDWAKSWDSNGMRTYVELDPSADPASFNNKFKNYIVSKESTASGMPFLMAMKDWRLRSNFEHGKQAGGRIEYVRLFGIIAVLLIVIACINFMNLATARSEKRSKEVGMRKVLGARRGSLMAQFIGESIVMALISMFLACLIVLLALPAFNQLVSKQLSVGFDKPVQWLIFLGIALLCGLLAGSYPSLYLSAFRPMAIFRSSQQGRNTGATLVRKGLVVAQFVVSIVLIISTIVIYNQVDHVKKRQLGINKDNLLYTNHCGVINEKQEVITRDLLNTGLVTYAASSSHNVLQLGSNTGGIDWDGKDKSKDVLITTEYVSPGYVNTTGMKLVSGRDFNPDAVKDSFNLIINQTMAKVIGKKDPVGTILRYNKVEFTVVGVVEDFVYNNMYTAPDPVIFLCAPGETNVMLMRLRDNTDLEGTLAEIKAVFQKDNPGYPFEYGFMDADFDSYFRSEMLIGKLSRLFAIITILVSCLGLFGLAAYTAERRTKEIGIRKVLGATVSNVVSLISKDFMKLVIIAIVIASPLAWYLMSRWLQDYAYRIDIHWWMFAAAAFGAILIALATVSFQAVKAAVTNPVKSLRTE